MVPAVEKSASERENTIQNTDQILEKTAQTVEELATAVQILTQTVEKVTEKENTIQNTDQISEKTAQKVEELAAAIHKLTQTVEKVSEKENTTQNTDQILEKTAQTVEELAVSVQKSTQAAEKEAATVASNIEEKIEQAYTKEETAAVNNTIVPKEATIATSNIEQKIEQAHITEETAIANNIVAPDSDPVLQPSIQVEEIKPMNPAREDYFEKHIIDLGGPLCVGSDRFIIFVANEDHEAALRCEFSGANCSKYSFPAKMLNTLKKLPKKVLHEFNREDNILFWRQNSRTYSSLQGKANVSEFPQPLPLINGTGLLLDNHVGAHQFGHTMNMLIPLIVLLESKELDFISYLADFLFKSKEEPGAKRWSSQVIESLFKGVLLKSNLNTRPFHLLRKPELNSRPLNATCFTHLVQSMSPERYFESSSDAELFQNAMRRAYPYFKPRTDSCSPHKAIVLYRSGQGSGLRQILNYNEVEKALLDNNITNYTNVTLSQDTSIEDALEIFSSAGLIISTHSSTLKMVVFAHPGTVIIEVRPTESATWFDPSVFSYGPDVMGMHYITNSKHNADYSTCTQSNCKEKGYIYSDIFVNRTELAFSIKQGLEQQKKRCPV